MVKRNDMVRFVNFELEDRPTVRKFMEENRGGNFTVDTVWSESERLIFLKGVKNYFQEQCLAVPRFKVGDKVRLSFSNIPQIVTRISSNVIGGRIHYIVRNVHGTAEKVVSEYDLSLILPVAESFAEWSRLKLDSVKDAESTLTQVDIRDGERLVAILYLLPEELDFAIPMLTSSYDNVSFRRVDEPPF